MWDQDTLYLLPLRVVGDGLESARDVETLGINLAGPVLDKFLHTWNCTDISLFGRRELVWHMGPIILKFSWAQ